MSLLKKLLCRHEWKKEKHIQKWETDKDGKKWGDGPVLDVFLFLCTKCGKFKKITM